MGKLKEIAPEYFLGTESRKFYRQERNFYRSFLEDKSQQNKSLAGSVAAEVLELTLGKALPNAMSFVGLVNTAISGDNSYLGWIAAGEGLRAFSHLLFRQYKKVSQYDNHQIAQGKRDEDFTESIYALIDKSTEGEEWKDN